MLGSESRRSKQARSVASGHLVLFRKKEEELEEEEEKLK